MIFKETYQQVLDGTKTQTRRPIRLGQYGVESPIPGEFTRVLTSKKFGRLKWQIFNTYAIQPGRGKKAVGRIRITKIRRERLQEILSWDVIAEGFPYRRTAGPHQVPSESGYRWANLGRFKRVWDSLYRKPYRWEDNPEVWVLEFERVNDG